MELQAHEDVNKFVYTALLALNSLTTDKDAFYSPAIGKTPSQWRLFPPLSQKENLRGFFLISFFFYLLFLKSLYNNQYAWRHILGQSALGPSR